MKAKGNRAWGNAGHALSALVRPAQPTEFERNQQTMTAEELKTWVRKHCKKRYVPESFLLGIGIDPMFLFADGDSLGC